MKMKLVALCGFMLICQTSSAGTSKVSLTASVDYSGGIAVEFNMGSVIFTAIFKPLTSCGWSISETQTPIPAQTQAIFFNRTCRPNTTDFTCSSHTYPLLVSTLRWPNILHTDVDVSFSCGTTEPIQTINIKAKYCSTSHHLQVHSSMNEVLINGTYGTTGNFACSNNGTLVYSNGLTPSLFSTTCQANAKWQGQNELQCVLVELNGKNNYTLKSSNKGDTDFSCSVSGNISALTNSNLTLQVGNEAKLPNFQIQPIDHGKEVRCLLSWQSTNTKIPSESKTLIVNYRPTEVRTNFNFTGSYLLQGNTYFLNGSQTLEIDCSFKSNPKLSNTTWFNNSEIISEYQREQNCTLIHNISSPAFINGTIQNVVGTTEIKNIAIIPVSIISKC
uniref:B-cell receptor CD22-like n=1 Tax=Phallusia mammillata TaxID=59560 RepID=A0A6F9D877_9ASCI|nr:B-cell receptor CD22-like [Phallusia mammillata]